MKKFTLLVSIFILAVSCSSDSDSTSNSNAAFIGKWTAEFERDYSSNGNLIQTYDFSDGECYQMTTYEFKANNQFVKDSYDYEFPNCIQNPLRTYPYTYSGNTIVIDGTDTKQIIENTTTVLKLKSMNQDNSYTIFEYSKVN